MHFRRRCRVLLIALFAVTVGPASAQLDPLSEQLRQRVEQLREGRTLEIEGTRLAAVQFIPQFYERRGFQLAWTDRRNVEDLLGLINGTYEHGLDPEDYHASAVRDLVQRPMVAGSAGAAHRVELDLLLTDILVRLSYHLHFGKLDPADLDADWNFGRNLNGNDPVQTLSEAIASDSLKAFVTNKHQGPYFYARLKQALADYRAIAEAGGWPQLPAGPTLHPGDLGERVAALRRRLLVTGDLPDSANQEPQRFDQVLEAGVRSFQERHGLEVDGKVGRSSLKALNVTVEERIGQLRVNLERIRWIYQDLPEDFVLVDIAGFHVSLVRGGEVVWTARAQVGRPFRSTPVFRSTMKYLVFNPTWTVPPTILRKDIIPKLKQNPDYLTAKNMTLLEADGAQVDPKSVDWAKVSGRNFPYTVRQEPGPDNALGRVKFMFPNPHFVYLHDTPSKSLFDRAQRSFSSGCIRVERPLELAELLLNDPKKWDRQSIQELLDGARTQSVVLDQPLPVLLFYWTAEVADDGRVHFREDIYGRDQRVLKALDASPQFTVPDGMPKWYRQG
jgi:murein L,D-transpeptidase YcbB/YkuD